MPSKQEIGGFKTNTRNQLLIISFSYQFLGPLVQSEALLRHLFHSFHKSLWKINTMIQSLAKETLQRLNQHKKCRQIFTSGIEFTFIRDPTARWVQSRELLIPGGNRTCSHASGTTLIPQYRCILPTHQRLSVGTNASYLVLFIVHTRLVNTGDIQSDKNRKTGVAGTPL
jgi:hypothetical protein